MTHKAFYSSSAQSRLAQARVAIARHDYRTLNTLLAEGLNPNIPGADGRYLVHDAVIFDAGGTALDILAHYHADVNARWSGYLDWTPAHIAWFSRANHVIVKLRALGADLTLKDARGWAASADMACPITRIEAEKKLDIVVHERICTQGNAHYHDFVGHA